jgi:hypothetical protein
MTIKALDVILSVTDDRAKIIPDNGPPIGEKMKKGLLILGAVVLLCLGALVSYATLRAETLYYAPVVNSTGEKVAYVKRLLKYSASGGSIMPFLGGSPTKVRIKSDRIQLCEKDLRTGGENILKDWKIRLVIKNSRGRIQPVLNWDLENLRYVIRMRGFGDIGIGIWRRPYGYLTNLLPGRDKTLLFRRKNIVESALYVKKIWGTIYGALGMRYGRKGFEWLQKEGSRCDHLLNVIGKDIS